MIRENFHMDDNNNKVCMFLGGVHNFCNMQCVSS